MNEALIEWLASQPEDFTLSWYADGMTEETPWETGWIDVMIGDRLGWVLSDETDEHDVDIRCPPDLVGMALIDPEIEGYAVADLLVTPVNEPPTPEFLARVAELTAEASGSAYWVGTPGWSVTAVRRAVEDWCLQHVGRAIQAIWDPHHGPSPFLRQAEEIHQAMVDGIEPKYLLRPGEKEGGEGLSIYASEQVMEFLLTDMVDDDL